MGLEPHPEPGWNPYRWVKVQPGPVQRATPAYRHRFEGLSGRFECSLKALTPLLVGKGDGRFFGPPERPTIPGSSLKGAFRALAELVGNAAVPFARRPDDDVDEHHRLDKAKSGEGRSMTLDIVARTFGYMEPKRNGVCYAGLIRFGDAPMLSSPVPPARWKPFSVVFGQPKRKHTTFYPADASARKFYHHKTGSAELTGPGGEIPRGYQGKNTVTPAPPGTAFRFEADFQNLRPEELALLTYCLVLEEDVTVILSREALGPDFDEPRTLRGPLRHKIGGCKPLGGGSVEVRVDRLILREDPSARYRAGGEVASPLEGDLLRERLAQLTAPFASRDDPTMRQLRAMLVYDPADPRAGDLNYPSYAWFDDDRDLPPDEKGRLKPTL